MEHLWVVDFVGRDVPEPRTSPGLYAADGLEVIVADTHWAVVKGTHDAAERAVSDFPYWRVTGHPADGRYIAAGGEEVYIHNGQLLDSERDLWEAMGLKPEDFDGLTWDDVDDDVVRDAVPSF